MAVMITILLMMGGCASLPTDFERTETHAYTDRDNTRIGQASQAEKLAHPGQSGFHLLGNGLVDGQPRVFKVDPYTGFWKRFGVGFLRILPIESIL